MKRRVARRAGFTLVEALVALLIVAAGLAALVDHQLALRANAELARERGVALRLAQTALERLRSAAAAGADPVALATPPTESADAATRYRVELRVAAPPAAPDAPPARYATVRVEVAWRDTAGGDQRLALDSLLERGTPPGLSAALLLQPGDVAPRLHGRPPTLPADARDLGDGRSAFKPVEDGTLVWIFDNASGRVVARCLAPATPQVASAAALATCGAEAAVDGLLVSGSVAFSWRLPPDADAPDDLPVALRVEIRPLDGSPMAPRYECFDDGGRRHPAPVRVRYHCVIYAETGGTLERWGGTIRLAGTAFSGDATLKVCRYSADYDGNGRIDNAEHPGVYAEVATALANQNFLVVAARADCPAGQPANPAAGRFADTATAQVQP
ncbi:MAG: prepilin-type N-terminal cleavage/methylation domain-containing protein [Pelomonas sp.]|nr:prepilin-type N-terminal cleavage/methylation domain-containing protein [Roseateles sp.]